ncbi:putative dinucleotide-binding enzyme [Streptomyces aurantiacus]|nr:putative dinucleotide-binding enzyme [Streptomyces aurantiacus]
MTTVGIIGSGSIGQAVASLAVAAGYDVVLSNSRGPETLAALVSSLGLTARAATAAGAAEAGDLVVVSVPLKAYRDLPASELGGKVVLSANNHDLERDGVFPELDGSRTTAELEQEQLPGAQLVKAFNTIFYKHLRSLARPAGHADRSALPIAGDQPTAKQAATEFLDCIGYDAVDVGTLADSWRFERSTPAWAIPYGSYEHPTGTPAGQSAIEAAVAAATRR